VAAAVLHRCCVAVTSMCFASGSSRRTRRESRSVLEGVGVFRSDLKIRVKARCYYLYHSGFCCAGGAPEIGSAASDAICKCPGKTQRGAGAFAQQAARGGLAFASGPLGTTRRQSSSATVVATCHCCGHVSNVPVSVLEGRSPMSRVVSLEPRLRCTECGHRGATLRVEWSATAAC
jgi:hypothetical protein